VRNFELIDRYKSVQVLYFLYLICVYLVKVFSFKLRGAYNMMAKLSSEQLERGVICSSAGNHAQGVALSAQRLGCDAVIIMPVTTPEIKVIDLYMPGAKSVPFLKLFCCRGCTSLSKKSTIYFI
jgi:cysteine synthase